MHYLRKEFNQLVKYAQGLGVKVVFSNKSTNASADWETDGSTITIYKKKTKTPLVLNLDLLHELAHHIAWVYKGRKGNLKTNNILDKEAAGKELTELQRKHIYEDEKFDSQYQLIIHHEIGSKIPKERVQAEIDLDLWIYKYYWTEGKWPFLKEIKLKRTELLKKHRVKHEQ